MDRGCTGRYRVHPYRNPHCPCHHREKTVLTPALEIKDAGSPRTTKILHPTSLEHDNVTCTLLDLHGAHKYIYTCISSILFIYLFIIHLFTSIYTFTFSAYYDCEVCVENMKL
jgi:hypothetical protein